MARKDGTGGAVPISDYGLIGDTRGAALCSRDGSIDWMCVPRFDSGPLFDALITGRQGGHFTVTVEGICDTSRRYRTDSAVLETTWRTESGAARLSDGMVLEVSGSLLPHTLVVRRLRCLAGHVTARIKFDPRRGLGQQKLAPKQGLGALLAENGSIALALTAKPQLTFDSASRSTLRLREGEELTLALAVADHSPSVIIAPERAAALLEDTDAWWRRWASGIAYEGPFRAAVVRSLVTLRLLTFSPSGAPVAAATTSLPEAPGGSRNWDYRLSWPRDACIGLAAFLAVGKTEEARSYLSWLLHAARLSRPRIEVLYTLYGKPGPRERERWDVAGYRKSLPVRLGNAASKQHQLDVYGWVLDAAWLLVRAGERLNGELWRALAGAADFVAQNWQRPDAGIWEVRGPPQHYVHSKLMAWLALNRALRIARTHRVSASRSSRWAAEMAALGTEIVARGYDKRRSSYRWAFDRGEADAALLVLPLLEFHEEEAPPVRTTVDAIARELTAGGWLLYRYPPAVDGLPGREGAFLPCSFWLAQALARLGEVEQASEALTTLLGCANDVGLLSEEIDPATGEQLGNFPQALSHAALVQAALAIADARRARGRYPEEARR